MTLETPDRHEITAKLYASVLSDVLDAVGLRNQALRPFVRPLDDTLVLFGRARTGLYMNVYDAPEGENPYEVEIALVDDLKPGEVAVFGCEGPTERIAPWGELLTTAAMARGAVGCLTDGLVRDVRQIRELGFAVFHGGIGPLDSAGRGRMMTMDQPIECGGVGVATGDYVFGDVDGVVVVPQDCADEVFAKALEKVAAENATRDELLAGRTLGEVYDEYGVL
ncbi:MAG: RraA family protein [Alphaproteobacteria bacterium]|jgi:regulator of RNase E activity RraA|nr:RraA family protein [Alphaproteobacteria bacterium]MDP7164474.1 RraA family protein [Alphaproteobacteria bacterium]MDP7429800.1 RraA family protein [Alphaproteobacteria bacterium]